jgi:endo-1,4-beta-xylanase
MDRVITVLDRFAALKKPIRITEFDINIRDEAAQADYTRDFYTALYSHPAVVGIMQWGFWEGKIWQKNAAMVRTDWTEKPNGVALRQLIKKTLASHHAAKTDAAGQWNEAIHHGEHTLKITVIPPKRGIEKF